MQIKEVLINDFTNPDFRTMFMRYFDEINVNVDDWDALFSEMNNEKQNLAYIRFNEDGSPVGFIQFTVMSFASWFFDFETGFIREFWVDSRFRGQGHGSMLLRRAEEYFIGNGVYRSILTTDTAESFYIRRGYKKDTDIRAKNNDAVFVKNLR